MSEQIAIALFTIFGGWLLAQTVLLFRLKEEVKTLRLGVKLFVDGMAKAAIEVLHSPDDHLGFDVYLDKYDKGHNDMSDEDWLGFLAAMDKLENDKSVTDAQRMACYTILSSFAYKFALHKASRIPLEVLQKLKLKIHEKSVTNSL